MFGTVRGLCTLAGAGAAGFLIWLSTQIGQGSTGGYWAAIGIVAGAGLTMALSQLFGGWTKWGVPRISAGVFLIGFLPVLIASGWVLLAAQPDPNWFQRHVDSWSGSIALGGPVHDLASLVAVLAFGVGLVFGFTFDTAGPRKPGEAIWETSAAEQPEPAADSAPTVVENGRAVDTPPVSERVPSGGS